MKINMHDFTGSVRFLWDMSPEEFNALHQPHGNEDTPPCYLGAVFFGRYKLEFMQNSMPGGYRNLFLLGREGYAWLQDDTPYDELIDEEEQIPAPYRRTFEGFARSVERHVIQLLYDHPRLIPDALAETDPDAWYPHDPEYHAKGFTRGA